MKNESIRKSIIVGVFVIAIFALAGHINQKEKSEEVAYYPIQQTSNIFSAIRSNITNLVNPSVIPEEDPLDGVIPDCIVSISNTPSDNGPGQCTVKACDGTISTGVAVDPELASEACNLSSQNDYSEANNSQMACFADRCLNPASGPSNNIDSGKEDVLASYEALLQSFIPGSTDPLVYIIEFELKEKGLFDLTPDMIFGYKTMEAVKLFQGSAGFPVTGKLDQKTLSELLK